VHFQMQARQRMTFLCRLSRCLSRRMGLSE
jgi:hypothetical protein